MKLLAKLKAHKATTLSDIPQEEDELTNNKEEFESTETPAVTNDMDVDTISVSKTHTSDHKGAPERHHKKVTISEPNELAFNEVKTKIKRSKNVVDPQRPMVGVRVHKIGGNEIKQEKLTNLAKLLEMIEGLDETAILLPHNKDESKAVKLAAMHLLQASKLKEFFDYVAEPWGAAAGQ